MEVGEIYNFINLLTLIITDDDSGHTDLGDQFVLPKRAGPVWQDRSVLISDIFKGEWS